MPAPGTPLDAAAPAGGPIPARAGMGLKPAHYAELFADGVTRPAWVEVHPENYMGDGGPPHRWLAAIRAELPLSLHGVGLSLGSADGVDAAHLERLAALVDRYQPALVSEHLAWTSIGGVSLHDLLPLPLTHEALEVMVAAVDRVQDRLGRTILIENPSVYLPAEAAAFDEPGFMRELCRRTGCGWLLDVNNVFVSCTNLGTDPLTYLEAVDAALVGEVHLAGHARERYAEGDLLIDDHGSPVIEAVWALFESFIGRAGARPTLIEWDTDIPSYATLLGEVAKAERRLAPLRERDDAA